MSFPPANMNGPAGSSCACIDAVIVGAGISGINTAYRLKREFPDLTYTVLESREVMGGTWSFWKYPGFRSDSYMGGYAFSWYKWPSISGIVDGKTIWQYVEDAAKSQGIEKKIRFSHRVVRASWSSEDSQWTMHVTTPDGPRVFLTRFIFCCAGYYDYETPFQSPIPGLENFTGQVAVPQFWPENLDYSGKKIVLIGSGATAITMLPALTEKAAHVTMLQRSPSYVFPVSRDRTVDKIGRSLLPRLVSEFLSYWTLLFAELLFIGFLYNFPKAARKFIVSTISRILPSSIPVKQHFNPSYYPAQQRLGLCPDADFFEALKKPNAEVVTDVIDTVTADAVRTKSGKVIKADIIIPATGLRILPVGGVLAEVDGKKIEPGKLFMWRGCMLEGVPNFGITLGYFRYSWTPGADTGALQLIRVMKEMRRRGGGSVTPWIDPNEKERLESMAKPFFDTNATYIVSALDRIPKVTGQGCWTGRTNWLWDGAGDLLNGVEKGLRYSRGKAKLF